MSDRIRLVFLGALWIAFGVLTQTVVDAGEIRGRVVDADTGAPLPCRLYVQTEDGKWLFARSDDPAGSAVIYDKERSRECVEKHTTLSAHPFLIEAPAGKATVTIEHGKEYRPFVKAIEVVEGRQVFQVGIGRWIDMPSRGWYSGDTHVHRKLEEVPNAMQAEDLHVAFPLTYWVRDAYARASQGGPPQPIRPKVIQVAPNRVIWPINTEYELFTVNGKSHTQGAVFVLNHRLPLDLAAPPVKPIADLAHREGALLDLDKHSWNWSLMIVPIMNVDLFELSNNHVWRTNFAFKTWTLDVLPKNWDIETDREGFTEWGWIDFGFKTYYAFLNCGFRMRPTGGTASGVHPVPLGFGRVYVHVDGEFSYDNWLDGLNRGESFVTTGPMLTVQINGVPTGAVFQGDAAKTARVTGSADSRLPLDRIEIIVNGEIARTLKPMNSPTKGIGHSSPIDETLDVPTSSWVAVRCFEKQPDGRLRFAHSAPSHFEIDGPVRPRRREVDYFIGRMDEEIARNQGVLKDAEVAEYEQAREIYRRIAERTRD